MILKNEVCTLIKINFFIIIHWDYYLVTVIY